MIPGIGDLSGAYKKASEQLATRQAMTLERPTLRDNVNRQLQDAEANVKRLQRVNELLDKNPEFEELLTLLTNHY